MYVFFGYEDIGVVAHGQRYFQYRGFGKVNSFCSNTADRVTEIILANLGLGVFRESPVRRGGVWQEGNSRHRERGHERRARTK